MWTRPVPLGSTEKDFSLSIEALPSKLQRLVVGCYVPVTTSTFSILRKCGSNQNS